MLQEISLEPSIRPEKQRALAVNIPSIQMWNRHGRSAYGRLTVHLCIVLSGGNFIGVAQEQTRNREAAVSLTFLNPRLLEQVQSTASSAEKNKFSVDFQGFFGINAVNGRDSPRTVRFTVKVLNLVAVAYFDSLRLQIVDHAGGKRTKINVGTFRSPGSCDRFSFGAALDRQGRPLSNLVAFRGELHSLEELLLAEGIVTCRKVLGMILAEYKGHMGHRMNEIVIGQNTFIHEGSP